METLDRVLRDFMHWTVYLHPNQCYLGRCIVVLKRAHVSDLFDIRPNEKEELFVITKVLRDILKTTFQPDLFNYAVQGNIDPQLHLHVIPRYKEPRTCAGMTFTDHNWGKNYSPYDHSFTVSDLVLNQIKMMIKVPFSKQDIKTTGFNL